MTDSGGDPDGEGRSVSDRTKAEFERLLDASGGEDFYRLTLFVTGSTAKSGQAIAVVRGLCEKHLAGRFELEVVDIYQSPERLIGDQIVAAPTLLKHEPFPAQKLVGNLHDPERVMVGLNIKSQEKVNWMEV